MELLGVFLISLGFVLLGFYLGCKFMTFYKNKAEK